MSSDGTTLWTHTLVGALVAGRQVGALDCRNKRFNRAFAS